MGDFFGGRGELKRIIFYPTPGSKDGKFSQRWKGHTKRITRDM
jgi:hypothetical protein